MNNNNNNANSTNDNIIIVNNNINNNINDNIIVVNNHDDHNDYINTIRSQKFIDNTHYHTNDLLVLKPKNPKIDYSNMLSQMKKFYTKEPSRLNLEIHQFLFIISKMMINNNGMTEEEEKAVFTLIKNMCDDSKYGCLLIEKCKNAMNFYKEEIINFQESNPIYKLTNEKIDLFMKEENNDFKFQFIKDVKDYFPSFWEKHSKNLCQERKRFIPKYNHETNLRYHLNGADKRLVKDYNQRFNRHCNLYFPDEWQSKVIDDINEEKSLLICAPTSAGKSFITLYLLEKYKKEIKRIDNLTSNRKESDLNNTLNSILIYIAPTQALCAQFRYYMMHQEFDNIAFAAKGADNVKNGSILICTPQMFDIYTSTSVNREWMNSIKYVVFDEFQSIGEDQIGNSSINSLIYSQIISRLSCPFIALSATLGNQIEVKNWLSKIHSREVELHPKTSTLLKYTDNHYFLYDPKHSKKNPIIRMNPITLLSSLPNIDDYDLQLILSNFQLSPVDIEQLWDVLNSQKNYLASKRQTRYTRHEIENFKNELVQHIDSATIHKFRENSTINEDFFTSNDITVRSNVLKRFDRMFLKNDHNSQHAKKEIKENQRDIKQSDKEVVSNGDTFMGSEDGREEMDLLKKLAVTKMYPALLFFLDSEKMNELALKLHKLIPSDVFTNNFEEQKSERKRRENLRSKLSEYENIGSEDYDFESEEFANLCSNTFSGETSKMSRKLWQKQCAEKCMKIFRSYDCKKVLVKDMNTSILGEKEYTYWFAKFSKRGERFKDWKKYIELLCYGIGFHNSSLPKYYRDIVEGLFRQNRLPFLFCSSSFAFGIDMPCKTSVIFPSSYLSTNLVKQMIGRAGRRGKDNIGNVIFYNLNAKTITPLIFPSVLPIQLPIDCITIDTILKTINIFNYSTDTSDLSKNDFCAELFKFPRMKRLINSNILDNENENYLKYSERKLYFNFNEFEIVRSPRTFSFHEKLTKSAFQLFKKMHIINENNELCGLSYVVCRCSEEFPANYVIAYLLESYIPKLVSGFSKLNEFDPEYQRIIRKLTDCLSIFINPLQMDEPQSSRKSTHSFSIIMDPLLETEIQSYHQLLTSIITDELDPSLNNPEFEYENEFNAIKSYFPFTYKSLAGNLVNYISHLNDALQTWKNTSLFPYIRKIEGLKRNEKRPKIPKFLIDDYAPIFKITANSLYERVVFWKYFIMKIYVCLVKLLDDSEKHPTNDVVCAFKVLSDQLNLLMPK